MKLAILTFHAAHNYGAVLQAYALKCFLEKKNIDVTVLDYRPYYIRNPYALVPTNDFYPVEQSRLRTGWRYLRSVLRLLLREMPARLRRRCKFEPFIHNAFNLSNVRYDAPFEANYDYDVYLIGSDQVWNPRLTQGFDDVYWGNFKTKGNARKVAYAVSMIASNLSAAQKAYVRVSLSENFSCVSLRECETEAFFRNQFSLSIPVVLDPTLLIEPAAWKRFSKCPPQRGGYVLVYALKFQHEAMEIAKKISRQRDVEIVEILTTYRVFLKKWQVVPTPEEFVGLFANADFVVTESFHGTAFAVNFSKPFVSLIRGYENDARQKTLLENLGLMQCLFLSTDRPDSFDVSYDEVESRIVALRRHSEAYLCNAVLSCEGHRGMDHGLESDKP